MLFQYNNSLCEHIEQNTKRFTTLFCEVIDSLLSGANCIVSFCFYSVLELNLSSTYFYALLLYFACSLTMKAQHSKSCFTKDLAEMNKSARNNKGRRMLLQ
jgi:hypothetical protein